VDLLNERGVRLMEWAGGTTLGIWRDEDCREVREAIACLGLGHRPIRHLEDPSVPERYRAQRPPRRGQGDLF